LSVAKKKNMKLSFSQVDKKEKLTEKQLTSILSTNMTTT